jgi:hypothetical protein
MQNEDSTKPGSPIMKRNSSARCTEQRNAPLTWLLLVTLFAVSCSPGNSSQGLGVYPKAVGAADETSAIQALRTIATAELQLKSTRGAYGDFDTLTQAGFLDTRFAGVAPNLRGYRFTITLSGPDFAVNADPQTTESQATTGSRHFYIDSIDNSVRTSTTRPATKSDPAL